MVSRGIKFTSIVERELSKIRQIIHRSRNLTCLGMRVNPHGKIDIAVPHQFLSDLRMHAARGQESPKGVAQGMEVQFPIICLHEQEVALSPSAIFFRLRWALDVWEPIPVEIDCRLLFFQ